MTITINELTAKYGLGMVNRGGRATEYSQLMVVPALMLVEYRAHPTKVWDQPLITLQIHSGQRARTGSGWSNDIMLDVEQTVRLIHSLYDLLPTVVQRGVLKSTASEDKYCPELVKPYVWSSDYY